MSGVYKLEIKTVFKHMEYDKKFDHGNMANVNDILYASPMQGVMEQIQEVIHESDLAHDDFIKECIVSVGIDPDALKATAELNVRLKKELRVARAMAVQKVEWISVDERLPEVAGREYLVWDDIQATVKKRFFYRIPPSIPLETYPYIREYFGNSADYKRYTHWMPLPEPPKDKRRKNE